MTDKILRLCREAIQPGDRIVAAVSGGADSMCLIHALQRVASASGAIIFVAHVNHQMRGEEAEGDARYVCSWAAKHGLPRLILRVDVKRAGGQSEEQLARQQRYRALGQACRHFRANKLATAHHADDQVETFLMNLLRGSGGRGLLGIPSERPLDENTLVIRPLLAATRDEIEAYCHENQLLWRTDATNDSLSYQRNIIRHQLLPQLRAFNPNIDGVLLNTIEHLRMDQELLSDITNEALSQLAIPSPLPFAPKALSVQAFRLLPLALQNRVVLELLPKLAGVKHVKAVLALLDGQTGASIDLPGGCRAYRLHDSIAIGRRPSEDKIPEISLPLPGKAAIGNLLITADIRGLPDGAVFWLPEETSEIAIGPRKPGDYFYPPGGGKKLKDYMIDRKIPRWLRDMYLVFRSGGQIFWVAGLARDQRFLQPGPGKKQVYIKLITAGGESDEQFVGEYWRSIID
jgi:tRNA(Ile)-lysidine synthase